MQFYQFRMHTSLWRVNNRADAVTGKAPIWMRIIIGGRRAEVATGVKATEAEWDGDAGRIRGKSTSAQLANVRLKNWLTEADRAYLIITNTPNRVATAKGVKLQLASYAAPGKPLTLLDLADKFYLNEARPEAKKARTTLAGYRARRVKLELFLRSECRYELLAVEVDLPLVRRFERYCLDQLGHNGATARKHINTLQQIISFGAHEGLLEVNAIHGYRYQAAKKVTDPVFLPLSEFEALQQATFATRTLGEVADAWLFCAYTGLSYVEYMNFNPAEHLELDIKTGIRWIRMVRQKTQVKFSVPLLPDAAALLDRHRQQLPKYSNQFFNRELKSLSKEAFLSVPLTMTLARHTFSQRMRDLGFSDEVVASMAGHNIKTMNQHYSRIRETRIAREMRDILPGGEQREAS